MTPLSSLPVSFSQFLPVSFPVTTDQSDLYTHFLFCRTGGNQQTLPDIRVISREKHPVILSFNRWRNCMFSSFGYDPLKCHDCGKTMLLLELYHDHHKVSLEELYERAMSKHRSCRSPSSSCAASPTCSKLYIKQRYA